MTDPLRPIVRAKFLAFTAPLEGNIPEHVIPEQARAARSRKGGQTTRDTYTPEQRREQALKASMMRGKRWWDVL